MANVIVQIYGIRTVEDARMVIDKGGHHIGVNYGDKVQYTPGQLTCAQAKEIFEGVQPEAVKVGLTCSEDVEEITENLNKVLPDVLHLSGDIEGITPDEVQEIRNRFPGLKIMQALPVLAGVPLEEQKVMQYVRDYEATTDFFLIDTKVVSDTVIGATGITHDILIDKKIIESTKVPCIMAGGLDTDNVAKAIQTCHPYGVDSYSWTNYDKEILDKMPKGKGCKDPAKCEAFIQAALNA